MVMRHEDNHTHHLNQEISGKKWQTEHRTATTAYPCCLPTLGEFSRSWSCRFASAKVMINSLADLLRNEIKSPVTAYVAYARISGAREAELQLQIG